MHQVNHDDHGLMVRLKKGDRAAFRQIFDRYQKKLLFYSIGIVKSDSLGEDIVQETFIRLWTSRDILDSSQSLSGFLHTIARNLALNQIKKAAYDQEIKKRIWLYIEQNQQRINIEEDLFGKECGNLLREAIDHLPPQRRIVFRLAREQGKTYKEIALKLSISKNTVRNHMTAALRDIKIYLNRNSDIALPALLIILDKIL